MAEQSSVLSVTSSSVVLSANLLRLHSAQSLRSLMKLLNSAGARVDP